MPPIQRLLQRVQRKLALWLRPGELEPDARDLNLRVVQPPDKVDFRPGQVPPMQTNESEERLRRWRERQQQSRAGPWQMK